MAKISVHSEIDPLEAVIIHRPGAEVDLVSPYDPHEALFDDVVFAGRAGREHDQLAAALRQFADVFELSQLVREVLEIPAARQELVEGLCRLYGASHLVPGLLDLPPDALAQQLIHGTPSKVTELGRFFGERTFDLPPLYNLYFTRDTAMCVNDRVIIGAMATSTRKGEALLMRTLFRHHPRLGPANFYYDGTRPRPARVTVEGGDILVLREDLLLIGYGERTSVAGIDMLIHRFAEWGTIRHVIIQEIPPLRPFIHLDMVFTMLDRELCLIHEPVIRGAKAKEPVLVELVGEENFRVERHTDLLTLLADLGLPLTPIFTGGELLQHQDREQARKGTNFFAMAPGKVIGYERNEHTLRGIESHGFRIVTGAQVQQGKVNLTKEGRVAVAMEGTELSRGGGGCRCMTLPVRRRQMA